MAALLDICALFSHMQEHLHLVMLGARAQVLVVLWAREVLDYNTALGLRVPPSSQFKQHLSLREYFYAFAPIIYQCLWSSPLQCLLNVLMFTAKITALRITSFK